MKNILFIVFTLFAVVPLIAQEPTDYEDNKIYRFVQQKAEPQEGMEKFQEDFVNQLDVSSLPKDIDKVLIRLRFVVEKDGSFSDSKVGLYTVKNDSIAPVMNDKFSEEVIRLSNTMPKWKPAQHEGHIVRSSYTTSLVVEINKVEKEQTDDKIYSEVDEKAEPEGGMEKFRSVFLYKLKKPYDMPSDIVTITMQFVVEKDGSFTNFRVLDNKYRIGEEAILLLKKMPRWKPAQNDGKIVRSSFTWSFTVDNIKGKQVGEIYRFVQQKAEPEGGMEKFWENFVNQFNVSDNLPSHIKMLRNRLKFVVETDGSLTDIEVLDNRYGMGYEAIRVLKTMPKWKPAQHDGKTVRSLFVLPINIAVDRTKEKSE